MNALWEAMIPMLPILLPFLLGWLLKSPLSKYIPAPVKTIVEKLDYATVQDLIMRYGTKQARRETAVEALQGELAERGIQVDYITAGQFVDYLGQRYKEIFKR